MNELNEIKTGYYNVYLAGDGEVFLRTLMRTSADVNPLYQTLIVGSTIAKNVIEELETQLG